MVSVTKIEISVTDIRGISYRTIQITQIFQDLTDFYPPFNTYITHILTPTTAYVGN